MTRIDPIMVLDAYRWTLMYPTGTAEFVYPGLEGYMYCCPIVAVSLYAKRIREVDLRRHADLSGGISGTAAFIRVICGSTGTNTEVFGVMRRLLDISRPYQHAYIHGYDRWPLDPLYIWPTSPDYDLGYADGGMARAMLEEMDFRIPLG